MKAPQAPNHPTAVEIFGSEAKIAARRSAKLDLVFFLGLGLAWLASHAVAFPRRYAIAGIIIGLFGWTVVWRRRQDETLRDLGLRTDNLADAVWPIGGFTVVAAVAIVGYAAVTGADLVRPELLVLLPIYPAWGVVQQLIVQGILHRRLRTLFGVRAAVVLTAVGFGLLHLNRRDCQEVCVRRDLSRAKRRDRCHDERRRNPKMAPALAPS
ncbi:MAG: CPBP family intramembrane glutamic endopeptidase [Myxococcota bacterium]